MSAKDQIKQIVDYFKKEPQLKDKTDGMAEGLLLGASLADESNERSKSVDDAFKRLQQEYTENGNGSQTTAEINVARDGEQVLDDRLKRDFGNVNEQLAHTERTKADITYVDQSISRMSGGAIKGTYTTLAALKAAYPDGAVGPFLVKEDNNRYVWDVNKLNWVTIGIYEPAEIGLSQVGTENISFSPVIGKKSKNLFNNSSVKVNQSLNSSNGESFLIDGYFVSDYFLVNPNAKYHFEASGAERKIAFYNENKLFSTIFYNQKAVTSPPNAKLARITARVDQIGTAQVEEGEVFTGYETHYTKLDDRTVEGNSLNGGKIEKSSLSPIKIEGYIYSRNLFNKDTVTAGKFIAGNGVIADNASYVLSDYIPIDPDTGYTADELQYSAFFNENKVFISGNGAGSLQTKRSPVNAGFIRVSVPQSMLDVYQIEKGTVKTSYEPYSFEIKYLKNKSEALSLSQRDRLYSIKDAWIAWENDQKFPVGIQGDSTLDGSNTTGWTDATRHEAQDLAAGGYGSIDYINKKAYPYLLEQLIKKETGKTAPRIYNIGYSGTYLEWAKPKLNDIFGGVYADVKMVGIAYGINDRTRVSTTLAYESMMRTNLEYFIEFFYNKGIQPFMVTSQATVEPYDQFEGTYPLRTAEDINSVANRVKRELANKYNLEIIEMTDFGEHVFSYSQYTLTELINDTLHFNDKGHELEAGFLFSRFCPRVITTKDSELLGFSSQRIKSLVPAKKGTTLHYLNPFEDGFKVKADYTKADENDMLIQDFWVLNYSKRQLELKAFITNTHSQYVRFNGIDTVIDSNGKVIGSLDVGLHHIQAYSGQSTEVDFKGFTLG